MKEDVGFEPLFTRKQQVSCKGKRAISTNYKTSEVNKFNQTFKNTNELEIFTKGTNKI